MRDQTRVRQMRNAIDQIESALMGLGDFVEMPRIFDGAADILIVAPKLKLGEVRRVCAALEECTRIINSTEFDKFVGPRKRT